ncbi:MAG: peptide deformylase [Comamonadaceae bacterium]|nr:peptide deformylase [Comamonadaceae bacterium]
MTVRDILKMGDPRLLRQAQPVTQFDTGDLHLLITDLLDTMRAADGAGLAAPQIAVDLQVVIFGTNTLNPRYPQAPLVPRTVLINPTITPLGPALPDASMSNAADIQSSSSTSTNAQLQEVEDWEGCLSVPGLRGKVPRFARIRYTGVDQFGDPIDRTVDGFHARVVQHECDHLIGKLYPMRVRDLRQFGFTSVLFPGLDAPND